MSRFETRMTCLCILNSCAKLDVGYENCVKKRNCEIDLIGCKTNLSALTPSDRAACWQNRFCFIIDEFCNIINVIKLNWINIEPTWAESLHYCLTAELEFDEVCIIDSVISLFFNCEAALKQSVLYKEI